MRAAREHPGLEVVAIGPLTSLHFEALHVISTLECGVLRTIEAPAGTQLGAPMRVATRVDAERALPNRRTPAAPLARTRTPGVMRAH